MSSFSLIFLILVLGILSKNRLIYISAGSLLVFMLLGFLPTTKNAQNILLDTGVCLLVMGVLMSLCSSSVSTSDIYQIIFNQEGFIAFIVGIASAIMAKKGVFLMKKSPSVVVGLLFGSIVSAAFLNGIPTGPLVAAGLVAIVLSLVEKFYGFFK